jgi:hypothetical protein
MPRPCMSNSQGQPDGGRNKVMQQEQSGTLCSIGHCTQVTLELQKKVAQDTLQSTDIDSLQQCQLYVQLGLRLPMPAT